MATTQEYIQWSRLQGPQRNAAWALIETFREYGLESLANRIIGWVKEGFSGDTIALMLKETPDYKRRFAANDVRLKNGLAPLSPREYIETERAYRQVMVASGFPKGFYDQQSDFTKFIGNDMSPAELQERVRSWQEVAQSDSFATGELRRLYGMTTADYAAYLMDPQRATPLLQAQARSVSFAAAGSRHGYTLDRALAEKFGGGAYDVTAQEAERGFAAIEEIQEDTDRLAQIYKTGGFSIEDYAGEAFGGDAGVTKRRRKLYEAEQATFSDSSRGATGTARGTQSY